MVNTGTTLLSFTSNQSNELNVIVFLYKTFALEYTQMAEVVQISAIGPKELMFG